MTIVMLSEAVMVLLLLESIVLLSVSAQHNLTPFGKATQSSSYLTAPVNAINPPIANTFSFPYCSLSQTETTAAWWMFQFSFGTAYITDITIYYRENYADRMDGFKLYVTNTSTITPDGYLCYEDPDPGLPDITQTIPCNQLGQYVIYFDDKGSKQRSEGPIVELCYVAINGALSGIVNNVGTILSILGTLSMYKAAKQSVLAIPKSQNCMKLSRDLSIRQIRKPVRQVGLQYIIIKNIQNNLVSDNIASEESTTREGNHTLYASNTSTSWQSGTILYKETSLSSEINLYAVFRYLTYESPVEDLLSELVVCEIGIVACQAGTYGKDCLATCSTHCLYPQCHGVTGECLFGCHDGWQGFDCSQTCTNGLYGINCQQVCSPLCLLQPCDHRTGECIGGCVNGLQGFNCTEGKENTTTGTQRDEQQYDDVQMENLSTYQEITKDSTSKEYDQINTAYINH
ncbi:unnamed protein product [Mytilus edulis]|uniref:Uncharacterized protein n=1 Tax=Mytilus edulis TaxID=6550 RepID=A0A8S3VEP0_MYTED|nr:unnamed protein product [Mytilus edulis]